MFNLSYPRANRNVQNKHVSQKCQQEDPSYIAKNLDKNCERDWINIQRHGPTEIERTQRILNIYQVIPSSDLAWRRLVLLVIEKRCFFLAA